MVELQNLKKMTDLLAENFENFWKIVVLRKIFRAFREKFLLSGKIFLRWPWNGRGPNFGLHPPPIRNQLARPCGHLTDLKIWLFARSEEGKKCKNTSKGVVIINGEGGLVN
jgi:hypothetical protein